MSDPEFSVPAEFSEPDTRGLAGHPRGLTNLFFAEMWERFSYYGMRALLILFMVAPIAMGGMGMDQKSAAQIYGNYTMASYMVCILGGFIADNFIGARRAVLIGGFIITAGHYTLALNSTPTFYAGLILVALGTGLLKPNISTLVGGLYSTHDKRRDAGFSLFYMGINLGAFAAPLVTGWLAQSEEFRTLLIGWGLDPLHSWHWGFGAAGVGMTFGMWVYIRRMEWIKHVGNPPAPGSRKPWVKLFFVAVGTLSLLGLMMLSDYEPRIAYIIYTLPIAGVLYFGIFLKDEDSRRLAAILIFFIAAIIFWAVYEQAGSSLTLFAEKLTRNEIGSWKFPSSYFQSVNAIFIVAVAPIFAWLWIWLGHRQPSTPFKFALGLGFMGLSFALMIPASELTVAGRVSPWWLVGVYFLQTLGEMCLSPVGLSTMTKLAPARLVGLIMGIWFLAMSLGNKLAGVIAEDFASTNPEALSKFFLQQTVVVACATLALFILTPWVRRLMGKHHH